MRPLESLLRIFVELHPEDAARAFETLDVSERVRLFKTLPVRVAVSLLERISPHTAAPLLFGLEPSRTAELLQGLPPRVASSVLHQLDEEKREELLLAMASDTSRSLRELARYPENTAGAIMEPRVASLSIDFTAQQAISAIRKAPRKALHYLYVTQRDGKLVGVLNM